MVAYSNLPFRVKAGGGTEAAVSTYVLIGGQFDGQRGTLRHPVNDTLKPPSSILLDTEPYPLYYVRVDDPDTRHYLGCYVFQGLRAQVKGQ